MTKELRAACPFCSLHCADLRLTIDEGRLTKLSPRCELGRRSYARVLQSVTGISELPIPKKEFDRVLTILESARRLLVVLSADAPGEVVEGALGIVRKFNSVLTVEDEALDHLTVSMKEVGGLSATLGELKEVDTVIACGAEPRLTLPRLAEFLGKSAIDDIIVIRPQDSFETIRRLRLALADAKPEAPQKFRKLIDAMRSAASGVVFVDSAFLQAGEPAARELLLWLRDLNRLGCWYGQYLPDGANSVGVAETLLSSGGIAGGLYSGEDSEEVSPRHWQAVNLFEDGGMDTCLFVGNPRTLQKEIAACLQGVNTVLIDPIRPFWEPTVWLPVAQAAVDAAGSMARLDGVPVHLGQLVESERPPFQMLLDRLLEGRLPS